MVADIEVTVSQETFWQFMLAFWSIWIVFGILGTYAIARYYANAGNYKSVITFFQNAWNFDKLMFCLIVFTGPMSFFILHKIRNEK